MYRFCLVEKTISDKKLLRQYTWLPAAHSVLDRVIKINGDNGWKVVYVGAETDPKKLDLLRVDLD